MADSETGAPRRAILLVNRHARRGGEALDPVLDRLRRGGLAVTAEQFEDSGELDRDLRRRAGDADLAIICGGDGTLNAAAPTILATGLPMGILPMGTANDLARTLGIPDDLAAAADIVLQGRSRRIDLGLVNDLPFFNVASIGLSADLSRKLDTNLKRRWGRLSYAIAAVRVLSQARRFSAWIEQDGAKTRVRSMQITVGSGRHYGGGVVVEENASIEDGRLDLYSLEMKAVWKLALMVRGFRSGTHGAWSEVRTAKSHEFLIRTRRPQPVYADGELLTETPARFRVLPGAVTVFAPPD